MGNCIGRRHLFTLNDEGSEEDSLKGMRARLGDPWFTPIDILVDYDFVWRRYIDPKARNQPLL